MRGGSSIETCVLLSDYVINSPPPPRSPPPMQIKGLEGEIAGDDVAAFVDADLSTEDSVKRAFKEASKCFKGVDAMVHIALPLKSARGKANSGLGELASTF